MATLLSLKQLEGKRNPRDLVTHTESHSNTRKHRSRCLRYSSITGEEINILEGLLYFCIYTSFSVPSGSSECFSPRIGTVPKRILNSDVFFNYKYFRCHFSLN